MKQNIILNSDEISHKINRMAYQIIETFGEEHPIIIAGISKNGYLIAERIANKIGQFSTVELALCEVFVDKTTPLNPVKTSLDKIDYQDRNLILIDDVLNSGTTLIYGVKHFLDVPLKGFKTAVLVDRNHKKYPVKADFKGISLSTSTKEHVEVVLEGDQNFAVLI